MPSAAFLDGLALAATLKGDRGQAVRAGLGVELGQALEARLHEVRTTDRERALASIAAALRPRIDLDARLPARAAALLAPDVPRATGVAWLSRAPLPRPGFRVSPALRSTLRRLARATPEDSAKAPALDTERALAARADDGVVRIARETGLEGDALAEALGAMERGARGDESRARWVRAGREIALLRAAFEGRAWRG